MPVKGCTFTWYYNLKAADLTSNKPYLSFSELTAKRNFIVKRFTVRQSGYLLYVDRAKAKEGRDVE
jgi:hypothetical protein